jgi:Uncharacterized conserved protein
MLLWSYFRYMVHSGKLRIKQKKSVIIANNCNRILPRETLIGKNNLGQYKGELHFVLKERGNLNRQNVVGHLTKESMILLTYVKLWSRFKLVSELKEKEK